MTAHVADRPCPDRAELVELLTHADVSGYRYAVHEIRRETVRVRMRDGVQLATDLYLPPRRQAPAIVARTPYGRENTKMTDAFVSFARIGFIAIAQDCRGTGDSEPDAWNYYMYERDDSYDCVEWITAQDWFNGFVASCGGSYGGQTQWAMALHPRMSTIAPEVSGLGIATNTAHHHMTLNAYQRTVGKGAHKISGHYADLEHDMLEETLATGFYNEPVAPVYSAELRSLCPHLIKQAPADARRALWKHYASLNGDRRVAFVRAALGVDSVGVLEVEGLSSVFGPKISHDAHTIPADTHEALCKVICASPLIITGWYDWGLNDALATWRALGDYASPKVKAQRRLIITPAAHNVPGYREGASSHPELRQNHRTGSQVNLLARWYSTFEKGDVADWPKVIFYLLGANEWRVAADWPPPEACVLSLYTGAGGTLSLQPSQQGSTYDCYTYDPRDPTPTVGGSIVSSVYPPGSVDVSGVQKRADVLAYTTAPLQSDLDVAGPLRLVLFASSSAVDTDFAARLSDVFPDGRAIQLQSGTLRARYRNPECEPELLEPGRIYRFEIDMWATANRFKAGHRMRLDISSADFPRFDRNTNLGGAAGVPVTAVQTIHHDIEHPSHLLISVLAGALS